MAETFGMAMIARNSEATIAQAIESAKELCENLYVVDTGSTDRTIEIARSLGAQVSEIPWPGRFDHAVNASFDQVVEDDWTLRLDSDEWLLPCAAATLRDDVRLRPGDVYSVIREDLHEDDSLTDCRQNRLYRTGAHIRLEGRIHEHFPRGVPIRVVMSEARIGHTGFAAGMTESKLRRNLELLRLEIEEDPNSWYYNIELARTLAQLEEPEGNERIWALADRLLDYQNEDEMPESPVGDLLAAALDLIPPAQFEAPRTQTLYRLARGWCSSLPGATWAAAQLQLRRGKLREAMDALLDLEYMLTTNDYNPVGGFKRSVLERATWQNLALVAHQLGRVDVARRNYERWLAVDPGNQQASQNLTALVARA